MNDPQTADFDFTDYISTASSANETELDIFADFQRPGVNINLESTQALLDNLPQNQAQIHHKNSGQHQRQQQHQHQQQQQQQQHQHQQQQQQQRQQQQQHNQLQNQLHQQQQQNHQQQFISAEMRNLKDRLEQQMKLQQLQQLILQQQIELLSANTQPQSSLISDNPQQKDGLYNGLPTPLGSAELPAIVPKDRVPPMTLQPDMFMGNANAVLSPHLRPHHGQVINPTPPFSAPAALAFPTSQPYLLSGHDISPLTSPWMLPHGHAQRVGHSQAGDILHVQNQVQEHQQLPSPHEHVHNSNMVRSHLKRPGSADEHMKTQQPARKRTFRNTPTSSATSTPAGGSGRGNGHQYFVPGNDSPSPVDLLMPPPVSSNAIMTTNTSPTAATAPSSASGNGTGNSSTNVAIAPMTPASILNLRQLSTGLVPSSMSSSSFSAPGSTPANASAGGGDSKETSKKSSKGKAAAAVSNQATRGRRGSTAKTAFSPNLKLLLPGAAQPPTPTSPLSLPTQPGASGNAAQRPSKSSHKVAEQKRRDSLKTSFDELRLLLPPVALPEDEELLPGCMPPRGPPKGDADGPNRGVSKLALLRCGNAYIKELKDMVKRRDGEISKLRNEVRRVRALLGPQDAGGAAGASNSGGPEEQIDLEWDVDEGRGVEAGIRLKMGSVTSGGDDEDE